MNKKQILITIIVFLISCFVLIIGKNPTSIYAKIIGINTLEKTPRQLYRVYLSGKSLGVIESRKELEDLIDQKQQQLKDKYKIDKVYAPNDLKIVKEATYTKTLSTAEEIYNQIEKIRGKSSFTIDGYKITIEGIEKKYEEDETIEEAEDKVIYVIDKELFEKSVKKTITAFIEEDKYDAYMKDKQKKLEENETGSTIENIYIKNNIKISKQRIPAEGNIYVNEEDLNKFLLFGTTKEQDTYIVKAGDTIETIANDNKLSVNEFLVANTSFKSASSLLFPGQQVKLGLIQPQFDLIELEHLVYESTITKETVYKEDNTQYVGYEKVEEEGKDGVALVTEDREITNGEVTNTISSHKVLVPAINKVVIRGTKKKEVYTWSRDPEVPVGIGGWVWPTNTPYSISSGFEWRWGKHHDGIDITGPGYGSPIKAANNGIVVTSSYNSINGNYILIKHSNGLYTYYGHLSARYKQAGDIVMAGDRIGAMGMTGFATGVHLHFGLYNGNLNYGGKALNPYTVYR